MDCGETGEQAYAEFSRLLHRRGAGQRLPISGSLEVTARCNVRCQHCYIPLPARKGQTQPELSRIEIERILDQLAEAGCLWLLLTGGEPFLRPDFISIYDYAKRCGFLVQIFTNGTLITPQIADHLVEWRPFNIEITLYGYSQETYEAVTGIAGSHARCMQGIRLLHERGLPLKLKTVLMTLNRHELVQMQDFAAELGVEFRYDPMINAALDGQHHPTRLRLSPEEIVSIESLDPDRSLRWPEYYRSMQTEQAASPELYLCSAGKSSFHISADGRLSLCQSARQPSFDLRRGSFRQGWDDFLGKLRQQEYGAEYACGGCRLRPVCSQCPAVNFLESGDENQLVPFVCQVAHLRQQEFSLAI